MAVVKTLRICSPSTFVEILYAIYLAQLHQDQLYLTIIDDYR